MFNQIKLHYKFVFSKEVSIILTVIIFLYSIAIIYTSGLFEGNRVMELYLLEYQEIYVVEYLVITKIISMILSVLLVIVMYTEQGLNLRVYVIDSYRSKLNFMVARILFSFILTTIITMFVVSVFLIVYQLFTPYYYELNIIEDLFKALFIQNIFYMLMSHAFISLIPSIITGFIPVIVYWYYEINFYILKESNTFLLKYTTEFIPNISYINGEIKLYNSVLMYLIFIVLIIQVYILTNLIKDIN